MIRALLERMASLVEDGTIPLQTAVDWAEGQVQHRMPVPSKARRQPRASSRK